VKGNIMNYGGKQKEEGKPKDFFFLLQKLFKCYSIVTFKHKSDATRIWFLQLCDLAKLAIIHKRS
jgi:hypothetical protein